MAHLPRQLHVERADHALREAQAEQSRGPACRESARAEESPHWVPLSFFFASGFLSAFRPSVSVFPFGFLVVLWFPFGFLAALQDEP